VLMLPAPRTMSPLPTTPRLVQALTVGEVTRKILIYNHDAPFRLLVEEDDGSLLDAGTHDTMAHAAKVAERLVGSSPAQLVKGQVDMYKEAGNKLLVCIDSKDRKWSIIAIVKNKLQDTGLRFDTEEEARGAVR